ncbi:MAG TPA: JAB domain-containing protein [Chitinophagales bacterium]|jgi:DNA repair protein RadC|nr:JAB domain-containing protein [Chitinophagales bacterium]
MTLPLTSILLDDAVAEIQVAYNLRIKHKDRIKVIEATIAEKLFRHTWNPDKLELQETFKVMLLNRNNQLLGIVTVSEGGICSTQVDTRLLLAIILKSMAVCVVLAHNHPSGNCMPSHLDFKLHEIVYDKCKFFNIEVLDHIILTADSFYSFNQSQLYGS